MELGNEKWIPVAEAAQRTGYSVSMVQRLCQKKRIKCTKIGRDWFTTLEAVTGFKENSKRGRPRKKASL